MPGLRRAVFISVPLQRVQFDKCRCIVPVGSSLYESKRAATGDVLDGMPDFYSNALTDL